jgi:hypothetical protein
MKALGAFVAMPVARSRMIPALICAGDQRGSQCVDATDLEEIIARHLYKGVSANT